MNKSVLQEAHEIIYGDREQTYGKPAKNLQTIADMWESYLRARGVWNDAADGLFADDVALMMVLMKVSRLANSPEHRDSLVDICGYAALVERIDHE